MNVKVAAIALRKTQKELGFGSDKAAFLGCLNEKLPYHNLERETIEKAVRSGIYKEFVSYRSERDSDVRDRVVSETAKKLSIVLSVKETFFVMEVFCRAIGWEILIDECIAPHGNSDSISKQSSFPGNVEHIIKRHTDFLNRILQKKREGPIYGNSDSISKQPSSPANDEHIIKQISHLEDGMLKELFPFGKSNWYYSSISGERDECIEGIFVSVYAGFVSLFGESIMSHKPCVVYNSPTADTCRIMPFEKNIVIRLAQNETSCWAQLVFQLSQLMMHYAFFSYFPYEHPDKESSSWNEVIICEAMSLYMLEYMYKNWQGCTLCQRDPTYGASFKDYLYGEYGKYSYTAIHPLKSSGDKILKRHFHDEFNKTAYKARDNHKAERNYLFDLLIAFGSTGCIGEIHDMYKYFNKEYRYIEYDKWARNAKSPDFIRKLGLIQPKLIDGYLHNNIREISTIIYPVSLPVTPRAKQSKSESIIAGHSHIVGIKSDGSVVAAGNQSCFFTGLIATSCDREFRSWRNIIAVAVGYQHTVGLKRDGSVVAVGNNDDGQCDVQGWCDIIAVSSGFVCTYGLKSNGTVMVAGRVHSSVQSDVSKWRNIVLICASDGYFIVGLKSDGTAVAAGENPYGQCDVRVWRDIAAISVGSQHTVGLKKDGTVIAVGDDIYGQCDVGNWRDVLEISAHGPCTVGLKSDGTVVAVGDDRHGQCCVGSWRDIVTVSTNGSNTVGLKSNGTVVAVGCNNNGQCNTGGWRDIIAVSGGKYHTVGLKKDGTVLAVGYNKYGQCELSGWRDIGLVE